MSSKYQTARSQVIITEVLIHPWQSLTSPALVRNVASPRLAAQQTPGGRFRLVDFYQLSNATYFERYNSDNDPRCEEGSGYDEPDDAPYWGTL